MDGFNVNTDALTQSGAKYQKASSELSDCARRLRKMLEMLHTQRIDGVDQAINMLNAAIDLANKSTAQAKKLGQQCEQISQVYEMTERQIFMSVEALSHGGNAFASDVALAAGAFGLAAHTNSPISPQLSHVDSNFAPAAPAIIVGNRRMSSEDWLMNRAIKATVEN
jgi:hypothetical protein